MRLLPYERLTLRSDDPPDVIRAKLATLVTTKWFFLKCPPQPFRGSVQCRHFKVVRVLGTFLRPRGHNGWQPVIVGDITPAPSGSEVRVRMRLSFPAGAFAVVWFGILFVMGTAVAWRFLVEGFEPTSVAVLGLWLAVMGAIGFLVYASLIRTFWTEVQRARSTLCDGLGCRLVEEPNRLVR